jgi:hypothetical protein
VYSGDLCINASFETKVYLYMSSLTVHDGGGFVWEDDRRHWGIFNITNNNNNIEKQGIARLILYPFLKTWYSTLIEEN